MKSMSFFVLGAAAGAAVAMLYSPKTGVDNRELIKRKAQEGTDYVKRSATEGADYVNRKAADLKKTATDTIEQGKAAAMGSVQDVETAIEVGKQAYGDAVRRTTGEAGA